ARADEESVAARRREAENLRAARQLLRHAARDRDEPEVLRASVFGDEEDAAAIFRPDEVRGRAVEAFRERALRGAVRVHQVKVRDVVCVVVLVAARVCDETPVGRDARAVVGPLAVCELSYRAAVKRDGVNLRVAAQVVCVGLARSEEHTSELQSLAYLVCRLLLEKKKIKKYHNTHADEFKLF